MRIKLASSDVTCSLTHSLCRENGRWDIHSVRSFVGGLQSLAGDVELFLIFFSKWEGRGRSCWLCLALLPWVEGGNFFGSTLWSRWLREFGIAHEAARLDDWGETALWVLSGKVRKFHTLPLSFNRVLALAYLCVSKNKNGK